MKILDEERQGKISRKELFSNLLTDMKNRRSKNITYELIAKSFKTTQLEQIEDMRRKNEEKRRRKALKGSDESDFEEE